MTLLALGTSSCSAFILSAILSLRNCPHFIFSPKRNLNKQYNQYDILVLKLISENTKIWNWIGTLVYNCTVVSTTSQYTHSFSDAVRVSCLSPSGSHPLPRLSRRRSAARRRLIHRGAEILGLNGSPCQNSPSKHMNSYNQRKYCNWK